MGINLHQVGNKTKILNQVGHHFEHFSLEAIFQKNYHDMMVP